MYLYTKVYTSKLIVHVRGLGSIHVAQIFFLYCCVIYFRETSKLSYKNMDRNYYEAEAPGSNPAYPTHNDPGSVGCYIGSLCNNVKMVWSK